MVDRTVANPIVSPCINLCIMDQPSGWCSGCGRTIDEIAFWTSGSAPWRDEVMAALPERLAALPQE